MKFSYLNFRYKQLLLIISLPALLGINILCGSFQFDDTFFIATGGEHSDRIRDWTLMMNFLSEGGYLLRSVYWLTLTVNFWLGNLNTFGYHLVNILLHALNGVLILFLCERLFLLMPGKAVEKTGVPVGCFFLFPLLSATLFLLLPIQTETTAYISSRSSSLVSFFYLLGIFFYLKFLFAKRVNSSPGKLFFLISGLVICIFLGLGTKKTFMSFPFIILLVHYCHSKLPFFLFVKKNRILLILFLLIPLTILNVKIYNFYHDYQKEALRYEEMYDFEHEKGYVNSRSEFIFKKGIYHVFGLGAGYDSAMYSPTSYLLTEADVVSKYYLKKLLFPFELNVNPDFPIIKKINRNVVFSISGMILVLFLASCFMNSRPIIPLSVFWFFAALLPTSSFIPLFDVAAEHRTYIASPGFAIFFGFFLASVMIKKSSGKLCVLANAVGLTLIICFSALTMTRNVDWQTELNLWSDSVRKSPRSSRSHHNFGLAYAKNNRLPEAIQEYTRVLDIKPSADTYINLAEVYKKLGFPDKAIRNFRNAMELDNKSSLAHYNLGVLYYDTGDYDKAIDSYETAISIKKNYPEAHNNLGEIYSKRNQLEKAKFFFEKALEIRPIHVESLNNLGILNQKIGDLKSAENFYWKAVGINPRFSQVRFNLGVLYLRQGKLGEAEKQLREAIRLDQGLEPAYANLGDILIQKGLFQEAVESYEYALKLKPDNPIIHRNLGTIYYNHLNNDEMALVHYQRTLELDPHQDFADAMYKIVKELSKAHQ